MKSNQRSHPHHRLLGRLNRHFHSMILLIVLGIFGSLIDSLACVIYTNHHVTSTIPRLEGTPLDEIVIVSPELVPVGTLMTKSLSSICGKVTDVPRARSLNPSGNDIIRSMPFLSNHGCSSTINSMNRSPGFLFQMEQVVLTSHTQSVPS